MRVIAQKSGRNLELGLGWVTDLALPLVAAGSIWVGLASAAVIENAFSRGSGINISPEMTGCPRAGSYVDRRDRRRCKDGQDAWFARFGYLRRFWNWLFGDFPVWREKGFSGLACPPNLLAITAAK